MYKNGSSNFDITHKIFLEEKFKQLQRPINVVDEAYQLCEECDDPEKLNLTFGVYKDENNKPYYFKVVKKAEEKIIKNPTRTKTYLDPHGLDEFNNCLLSYFLKGYETKINNGEIKILQTFAATGALTIAFNLIRTLTNKRFVHTFDHFYPLYADIIAESDGLIMKNFPYYDKVNNAILFDDFMTYHENIEPGSVILLNTCCHNPTSVDFSQNQWESFANLAKKKNFVLIMDSAYLGYDTGDPFTDFYPVRMLIEKGISFFAAISFSKSLGLYSERIGCLLYHDCCVKMTDMVYKRALDYITAMYVGPQRNGAEIVFEIISNNELLDEWKNELKSNVTRIRTIRENMYNYFVQHNVEGDWKRILNQKGLYIYLDLNEKQINYLRTHHHIFIVSNGRINISGLQTRTFDKFVTALRDVITNKNLMT